MRKFSEWIRRVILFIVSVGEVAVWRNRNGGGFCWWEWASVECLHMALHLIRCSDRPSALVTLCTSNIVGQIIKWTLAWSVDSVHACPALTIEWFNCVSCTLCLLLQKSFRGEWSTNFAIWIRFNDNLKRSNGLRVPPLNAYLSSGVAATSK